MDMSTSTMHHTMAMSAPTHTAGAMDHGSHAGMDHSSHAGMDHSSHAGMDHGGMGGCKISMLFNLHTIDACFLSEQWHISSVGMFAGSCIGVFFLGLLLEFLRRSVKEFDRYLIKQHVAKFRAASDSPAAPVASAAPGTAEGGSVSSKDATTPRAACAVIPPFRPNILQQAIRALLHLLTFVVGYMLMLLAMYYNGYILLCIFLGVLLGAFIFQWEPLPIAGQQTSAAQEPTVCCG